VKISYRREMKRNYLIVEPEAVVRQGYEYQMLLENKVEGLLPFSVMQTDEKIRFYYEITSRQPLDRLLEGRNISAEEIRLLVFGIAGVLNQLDRFLLNESSILLQPEYIYVEPDCFRLWLCVVPGLNLAFSQEYGKLLEYLLGHVDHQDKDCVILAYGLYQETKKENYGINDILNSNSHNFKNNCRKTLKYVLYSYYHKSLKIIFNQSISDTLVTNFNFLNFDP